MDASNVSKNTNWKENKNIKFKKKTNYLTWLISVTQFKSVEKMKKFPDGNLKSIKQPYFGEDSVARLQSEINNNNFHRPIKLLTS